MQALQRLGIIVMAVGLVVGTAGNAALADQALLEKQGVLASGDAVLDDGSLYDQYAFLGSSGQQLIIYLESQDFDPYLILLDPTGRRISENDDISRTNRNSRLVITLPSEGTYTVVANSYEAGKSGTYKLMVNSPSAASMTRTVAQEMTAIQSGMHSGGLLAFSESDTSVAGINLQVNN